MGIARYLSKLASVLSAEGVVPPSKGGTGVTSPGASGNVLVSNGTAWVSTSGMAGPTGPAGAAGVAGPTGPAGTNGTIGVNGATGPTGPSGLGFTIAKTYSSVAQLTADTAPTGIVAGQFALVDTGDVNNAENSRLYIWNGTSYTYTSDLSGAQGIQGTAGAAGATGPTGPQGTAGTAGPTGPTGPAGTAGATGATGATGPVAGSANQIVYKDGTNTATGSANLTFDGTNLSVNGVLKSTVSAGDEGGEIFLAKPQTNSTIGGTGVTVDIYQNKLRIFEQGGTNRGAYLDLTAQAAGVGTALGAGASGGGVTYNTGDVVLSASTTQYTAPTWLPCDGAMYTPGTYPSLDTLYQTPGDYSVTPGVFTEPRNSDNSGITWTSNIVNPAGSILDPITGDLLTFNSSYSLGSRILYVQRASDGRFVYNSANQLATNVQADFGSAGVSPTFAISPNGQYLCAHKYSGGQLFVVYKRNTTQVETSTGIRWARMVSTTSYTQNVSYYGLKINNDGAIIFGNGSTTYWAWAKYDIPSNTLSGMNFPGNLQTYATTDRGTCGIDWHPTLTNYVCFATATSSYQSGMYYWNGNGYSLATGLSTANNYYSVTINTAGTGAYFSRNGAIDVYSINSSTGALTFSNTIVITNGGFYMQVSFSQGDAFMSVVASTGLLMYQRAAVGSLNYTATGYSPENYSNYGVSTNVNWKLLFDPVYNVLVGFGWNGTTGAYPIVNWKGTPKTIVPITANPGKNLKYYIKTGS